MGWKIFWIHDLLTRWPYAIEWYLLILNRSYFLIIHIPSAISKNYYFAALSFIWEIIIVKNVVNFLSRIWYFIISLPCIYFVISEIGCIFVSLFEFFLMHFLVISFESILIIRYYFASNFPISSVSLSLSFFFLFLTHFCLSTLGL